MQKDIRFPLGIFAICYLTVISAEDIPCSKNGHALLALEYPATQVLHAPNFTDPYDTNLSCLWFISGSSDRKAVYIDVHYIDLPGDYSGASFYLTDGDRCPMKISTNYDRFAYVSTSQKVQLTFITGPENRLGLKGFNLTFSETSYRW